MVVSDRLYAPAAFPSSAHGIGGWMGPKLGADTVEDLHGESA